MLSGVGPRCSWTRADYWSMSQQWTGTTEGHNTMVGARESASTVALRVACGPHGWPMEWKVAHRTRRWSHKRWRGGGSAKKKGVRVR
jgi:hypothetical protein